MKLPKAYNKKETIANGVTIANRVSHFISKTM